MNTNIVPFKYPEKSTAIIPYVKQNIQKNIINGGYGPGFSSISLPINTNEFVIEYNRILFNIFITFLFNELYALVENEDSKIFILAKYQYEDSSVRTLHKGHIISITKAHLDRYLELIFSILDSKSNDYDLQYSAVPITHILFNFFIVPKGTEGNYISRIEKSNNITTNKVILENFSVNETNFFLPLDRDYLRWGKVLSDSESLIIIQVEFNKLFGNIIVDKTNNKITFNFKGHSLNFTDNIFKDEIWFREFEIGTKFYIKDSKIILKIKPNKTEFIKKILPSKG